MKLLKTLFSVGAISVMSICSLSTLIPSSVQAQIPTGRYEVQPNGQIFFQPADRTRNPIVVYTGTQRALSIVQYSNALYTAFDGGGIYRSPDGQSLGGGGSTTRVYPGSQTRSPTSQRSRGSSYPK
jgi:hypothetical protein